MSELDPLGAAKGVISVAGEVVKLAKENPDAREAASYAAKSAKVVMETIHTVLLPLAAVNYGARKAHDYFVNKFGDDLSEKLVLRVPAEDVVEPKASIAGPALQGLAFSHEESELREMYLELLAAAMDGRDVHAAHPAFVDVIKQLTAEEIPWLQRIIGSGGMLPLVEIRALPHAGANSFEVIATDVVKLTDETGVQVEDPAMQVAMINWIRLGLMERTYSRSVAQEAAYSWLSESPVYVRAKTQIGAMEVKLDDGGSTDGAVIETKLGVLNVTPFGAAFGAAVGMRPAAVVGDSPDAAPSAPNLVDLDA